MTTHQRVIDRRTNDGTAGDVRQVTDAVLVVTGIEDVTADLVITCLAERGAPVVRLDPADIGDGLTFSVRLAGGEGWSGPLATPTRIVNAGRVRSVYWRRPSPWRYDHLDGQAREFARAEARHGLFGTLTCLPARYVSHPMAITRAEYKPAQLAVAAELGFAVPPTLITNDVAEARRFAADHAPVVYKTFRGVPADRDGNVGAVWTQRISPADIDESIRICPHLFQAEIAKDCDVRVTVAGDRVFATAIRTCDRLLDWRAGDWNHLQYEPVDVPAPVTAQILAYLQHFGLAFGAFDFIIDPAQAWWLIECNPNGQWGFLPDAAHIAAALADLLTAG